MALSQLASTCGVVRCVKKYGLYTVCVEAACPNRFECFAEKSLTFLLLGPHCTRSCNFCNVSKNEPLPPTSDEPYRVACAVDELALSHVVLTSVTRDDLPDGGAAHFAETIRQIRALCSGVTIEVLVPDFAGDEKALSVVIDVGPDIINHNIETVSRLYSALRPEADYLRSLKLLGRVKDKSPKIMTKSGIMVGLGEDREEVVDVIARLADEGCDYLTIGQYYAPSVNHHPVYEFVGPELFTWYKQKAIDLGFKGVLSSARVRSSYMASKFMGAEL